MSNIYNIVFREPVLEASRINKGLEQLALKLVKSGRMRIDAYEMINFIRYSHLGNVHMFSNRELFDPALVPRTTQIIGQEKLELLRREIATNPPVPLNLEVRLARMLVQAAHPAVIRLLIHEKVEVFISYSHNIGDLLDLESWRAHGSNSGMQSIGASESRVFVSTDGDPFATSAGMREAAKYSRSRFMVIAAQELGHYSDLKRDRSGKPYFRFSLEPRVNNARLEDLAWLNSVQGNLEKLGLREAAKLEKDIAFYRRHKRRTMQFITMFKSRLATRRLHRRAVKANIRIAPLHTARYLSLMLADMRFNLHPKAPAYKHADPVYELQIINIEALARVPQQVIKWGHKTTAFVYPNMYKIYYNDVIPANAKAYEQMVKK